MLRIYNRTYQATIMLFIVRTIMFDRLCGFTPEADIEYYLDDVDSDGSAIKACEMPCVPPFLVDRIFLMLHYTTESIDRIWDDIL